MFTKKRERKNGFTVRLVASFCLLLLAVLLLVTACSNNYQNPGSPGTPQATPTGGGYSMIQHVDKEMPVVLVPYR